MNHRPLPEDPYYLMKRRALRDAEKRAKKKQIRKQNIKKGSESPCLYMNLSISYVALVKLFEQACQEFKEVMGSGMSLFSHVPLVAPFFLR